MKSYEDFSLKNPSLTHYLSRILKRYPLGGQIIKVIKIKYDIKRLCIVFKVNI